MSMYDDYPFGLSSDEYWFYIMLEDDMYENITELLDAGASFIEALDEYNLVGEYWR